MGGKNHGKGSIPWKSLQVLLSLVDRINSILRAVDKLNYIELLTFSLFFTDHGAVGGRLGQLTAETLPHRGLLRTFVGFGKNCQLGR